MQESWAEDALWQGLLAHDPRALEALIARFAREVSYFVRMVLDSVGTAQDAEECVNDLFVTVWEDIGSFDPTRGTLQTWLTMRAKYLALDRRRQIQRRQQLAGPAFDPRQWSSDDVEAAILRASSVQASAAESLEGLMVRREQQEQLRQALVNLPELDRLLVYLRYFRLASTDEIADKTGLTRRAIDTRLWRARRHLRETLEAAEERTHGPVRAL